MQLWLHHFSSSSPPQPLNSNELQGVDALAVGTLEHWHQPLERHLPFSCSKLFDRVRSTFDDCPCLSSPSMNGAWGCSSRCPEMCTLRQDTTVIADLRHLANVQP